MVIMRVLVVELLCHTVMGWLLVLKYLLSGARGCVFSCLVASGIKCHRFPRIRLCWCLSDSEKPPGTS
jgi:hypothetical protein